MLSNRVPQAINPGVKLKDKLILFLKIEALTLVIGLSFILRHVALGVIKDKKAALVAQLPVPFMSSVAETLKRLSNVIVHDQWMYLLPFYGACLFAIRIDLVSRSLRDVFLKWSLLFFIMEFTTEWTKYGWDTVSADFPIGGVDPHDQGYTQALQPRPIARNRDPSRRVLPSRSGRAGCLA